MEENYEDFEEYGRRCYLVKPYLGYYCGTIVGREEYRYAVELTNGAVIYLYPDEIEFN